MPAAAVIPAPIVYTSIVAVKTFVVEFYTPRLLSQLRVKYFIRGLRGYCWDISSASRMLRG